MEEQAATTTTTAASPATATSTVKRDRIRSIEKQIQTFWEENHVFQCDAPEKYDPKHSGASDKNKYLATFPFPYMNGLIHLGHLFTLTKAEFAVGFKKLCGSNAMLPFAFHCTGMPICGAAHRLRDEIADGTCAHVIEKFRAGALSSPQTETEAEAEKQTESEEAPAVIDVTKHSSKKSKLVSKSGKTQTEVLLQMGIPPEDLEEFTEPRKWVQYFSPRGQEDLKYFGLRADWRRSFVTTDANPYYDRFVQWQFNHLREKGVIRFGKRMSIFCPKDGEPCSDHARTVGENVKPQDYVCILLQLQRDDKLPQPLLDVMEQTPVFLAAATLRPETMFGQTNCWVKPGATYHVYQAEGRAIICSHRAARNMVYQDTLKFEEHKDEGRVPIRLADVCGDDLIGRTVKAPLSMAPDSLIPILPMQGIDMEMGTGIVTCVPTDAPHDYISLRALQTHSKLRDDFGLSEELVNSIVPIPIISVPELGDMCAVRQCELLGIRSPNDTALLTQAKAECYKKGFHRGTMLVGEALGVAGMPVAQAKEQVKDYMVAHDMAFLYSEPEALVISRAGAKCVVAPCDQWYLTYGEPKWRAQVEEMLANMETFGAETRAQLAHTIAWMTDRGCSRGDGLGTHIPWDPKYLIESLSDSTIYPAYYTICHMLQGENNLDGTHGHGPAGIPPEMCDDAFFDFVFLGRDLPQEHPLSLGRDAARDAVLLRLRREFVYWYPVDLRVSGKDLVCNHLVMYMYNHAAIWGPEMWPRGIRANGHIMVDGKKMSKSNGNFILGRQGIDEYSADGLRMSLAEAGDGVDDANFVRNGASKALLTLTALLDSCTELQSNIRPDAVREADSDATSVEQFADRVFSARMDQTELAAVVAAEETRYRDLSIIAFRDMRRTQTEYERLCGDGRPRRDLLVRYLDLQTALVAIIAPHTAEHIWRKVLGHEGEAGNESVFSQRRLSDVESLRSRVQADAEALQQWDHVCAVSTLLGKRMTTVRGPRPTCAVLQVAPVHPMWRRQVLAALREEYDEASGKFRKDVREIGKALLSVNGERAVEKRFRGKIVPYCVQVSKQVIDEGVGMSALQDKLPFDEAQLLTDACPFFRQTHGLSVVRVERVDDSPIAEPGRPAVVLSVQQ